MPCQIYVKELSLLDQLHLFDATNTLSCIMALTSLPTEILHKIASPLVAEDDYLALRLSCKNVNRRLPRRQFHWTTAPLLRIERWLCYNPTMKTKLQVQASQDYFACCSCLRILPASRFANLMMKGARGKRSPPHLDALPILDVDPEDLNNAMFRRQQMLLSRECLDCGAKAHEILSKGWIQYGGRGGGRTFICSTCNKFHTGACIWLDLRVLRLTCGRCLERSVGKEVKKGMTVSQARRALARYAATTRSYKLRHLAESVVDARH